MTRLGDVCEYRNESIAAEAATSMPLYISTDSMMPNRGPIFSSTLPNTGKVKRFQAGDTLVSNIRPYFKKIWRADAEGACSNDVLVFTPTKCLPDYLHWILSSDDFFSFVTKTSKGTKMPRGDKRAIMNYSVQVPSETEQHTICAIMDSLQKKITINGQLNDYLEQLCQSLFDRFDNDENNLFVKVSDIADVNPRRTLKKGEEALCVEMADLSTTGAFPTDWRTKAYNGGVKFVNGDTILARITPCLENGKAGYINFLEQDEVAFGSTEYIVLTSKGELPSEFFYFLARNEDFISYATAHMNGSSGRQRVSGADVGNYEVRMPSEKQVSEFKEIAGKAMRVISASSIESRKLAQSRDALLPKLMSGEIDVSEVDLTQPTNNHLAAC